SPAREIFRRKEDRHELVAALAELRTHLHEGHLVAKMREGFLPGFRVQVDRIDEGAVYVENNRSDQRILLSADGRLRRASPSRGPQARLSPRAPADWRSP